MKIIEFLEFVKEMKKPVFSINDACKITGKGKEYTRLFLFRMKKNGKIMEIERGKYGLPANPFSVASNIIFPSYISFFSGLSYYGKTTQMPRIFFVAALESKKSIKLKDYEVKFVKLKQNRFFGYKREEYGGKVVFAGEIEKVILDCLLLPKYCPIKETFFAIENSINEKSLNINKLIEYTKKIKSSVLAKRLGYLLELANVNKFEKLKPLINSKYERLNPLLKESKNKNKKWKIIINENLREYI